MKNKKFKRKLIWTTIWGALEIGILLLSSYLTHVRWFKNALIVFLGMLIFFILSYITEFVEDRA